jgi:hypothetical protein
MNVMSTSPTAASTVYVMEAGIVFFEDGIDKSLPSSPTTLSSSGPNLLTEPLSLTEIVAKCSHVMVSPG